MKVVGGKSVSSLAHCIGLAWEAVIVSANIVLMAGVHLSSLIRRGRCSMMVVRQLPFLKFAPARGQDYVLIFAFHK